MAQRKKDAVRDAIQEAAFIQFSEKGYHETTIPAIARAAGISTANVYVYYRSKIDILFALYEPWLLERLEKLDRALERIPDKHRRLERLLLALWRDLPRESNGFANNVMQAVSASNGSGDYSPRLRKLFQERVAKWLINCLDPLEARDAVALAGVLLMAFDGFAINVHLAHGLACDARLARHLAAVLTHQPSAELSSKRAV